MNPWSPPNTTIGFRLSSGHCWSAVSNDVAMLGRAVIPAFTSLENTQPMPYGLVVHPTVTRQTGAVEQLSDIPCRKPHEAMECVQIMDGSQLANIPLPDIWEFNSHMSRQ